jgi:hypothetical protein
LLRALMVRGRQSVFGLGVDLGMLALAVLVAIARKLYPRILI